MIIELRVTNAYSKGGIPLKVDGVANIKLLVKNRRFTMLSSGCWVKAVKKSRKLPEKLWKATCAASWPALPQSR